MNSSRCGIFKDANRFFLFAIIFVCIVKCHTNGYSVNGFRNSANEECIHGNTTFGRPVYGQRLLNTTKIDKSASWFGKNTVKVRYPPYGSHLRVNISQVQIVNNYRGCDCYWNDTKISSGGIGKSFVEVSLATGFRCPIKHSFLFYNSSSWR